MPLQPLKPLKHYKDGNSEDFTKAFKTNNCGGSYNCPALYPGIMDLYFGDGKSANTGRKVGIL